MGTRKSDSGQILGTNALRAASETATRVIAQEEMELEHL